MKKTIIINIGNSIIHIEEDAYEVLTAYLNEIKQHFAKNADDFEIVTDIENRIAEMLTEILAAAPKQVVEMADVDAVIAQMGRVQDFQHEEDEAPQANPTFNFSGDKKLYRDMDDAMIAGVCSGLGHYINIEARWIRLVAFLSVFIGGAGILAYLILWIAIPRARSRSEKMEMKGEATNLYGYQRNFEEEMAAFAANMKSTGEKHFKPMMRRSGSFISEFLEAASRFFNGSAKAIFKLIAGVMIVLGFGMMIALVVALAFFFGIWDANAYDYFPFSIVNENFRNELLLAAFASLFVPVLALVLFSIRVAFNKMSINKTVSFALLIIWLIGVSTTVYYVARISSEFQEHAELVRTTELKAYPTYRLDVDRSMIFSKEDSLAYHIGKDDFGDRVVVDNDNDHPFRIPRNVHLEIVKSDNGKTSMVQTYESQGKTFSMALKNAQNIDYKYTQNDSLLVLSPRLQLKKESIWRNQELHITLKVPVGTHLLVNDNIYMLHFYYFSCNADEYKQGEYKEWIMTEEGLKCKNEL